MKQIIVAIVLLSFSVAALALSPDVLWTASDPNQVNNAERIGIPPVVQLELTDSGMLLNWAEITNATGYKVYKANAPEPIDSDAWILLETLPPETLSYVVAPDQSMGFFYVTSTQDDGPDMPENFIFVAGGTINGDLTVGDFSMDKYQITQERYVSVMGDNPSTYGGNANFPVETVSWFNAIEYCNLRSIDEGLNPCYSYGAYGTNPDNWPTGWNASSANLLNVSCDFSAIGYRLPSEEEWEYAARGGLQTHGYTYSGSNDIDAVAWYSGNSGFTPHNVGEKPPNELGFYDMSGNVFEWCWDVPVGSDCAARGGCWAFYASFCEVAQHTDQPAIHGSMVVGFRVCRTTP